jgi:CheY-like chemotaxis protein
VNKVRLLSNNKSIFTLIISMVIIIIMDSSLTIFCTPRSNRIFNVSNTELYFIYSIILIISNIVLFNIVKSITSNLNKYYYYIILIIQGLYDLVLLDLKMTKMNGVELFKKLQNIDPDLSYRFITAANKAQTFILF